LTLSPTRPLRSGRRAAAFALFLLAAGGCAGPLMQGQPRDAAYLRPPDKSAPAPAGSDVFPGNPGSRWTFVTRDPRTGALVNEELVAAGTRSVGGVNGLVWERRRSGKTFAREVYARDASGVRQLAVGPKGEIVIEPPLPVFRFPAAEGATYNWRGNLRTAALAKPAEAAVRLTRRESVQTPAGKFSAYRVDTVLTVVQNGRSVVLPSVSWYAPRVGLVKQQYVQGSQSVVRELTGFRLR